MRSTVKIIVLLFAAGVLSEAAQPYKIPGTNSLFLGSVEGKSYLAEDSTPRTWNSSSTYCTSLGMRLASVETVGQRNFLAGIDHPQFQGCYWTAGRDAKSPQQFVWNHNSASVSASIDRFAYYVGPRSCVIFTMVNTSSTYQSIECELSATRNCKFGALCESA